MSCAGCYVCAYLPDRRPAEPQPLPSGSPVGALDPLASCNTCSVWACSLHGTRYTAFECAICTQGKAVKAATAPDGGPDQAAAAVLAREAGRQASDAELRRADVALELIASDQREPPRGESRRDFADEEKSPNLVYGLAAAIREGVAEEAAGEFEESERGFARHFREVPKVQGFTRSDATPIGGAGRISIEAIGAAVEATFADVEISPRPDAARILHGAVVLALSLADAETAGRLGESKGREEIPVKAPWEVSHPVLLDPAMWMVLTAYRRL
jgi:hypothetical protein